MAGMRNPPCVALGVKIRADPDHPLMTFLSAIEAPNSLNLVPNPRKGQFATLRNKKSRLLRGSRLSRKHILRTTRE